MTVNNNRHIILDYSSGDDSSVGTINSRIVPIRTIHPNQNNQGVYDKAKEDLTIHKIIHRIKKIPSEIRTQTMDDFECLYEDSIYRHTISQVIRKPHMTKEDTELLAKALKYDRTNISLDSFLLALNDMYL
jgi:hypothetical protein